MELIQLDGWKIRVRWDRLYYQQSFFVPSVNVDFDKSALLAAAAAAECEIGIKQVVEDDVQGLRIWKI